MTKAHARILLCLFAVGPCLWAGPIEDRLAELEAKATLTAPEVQELVDLAGRGNHESVSVNRRDRAVQRLQNATLTATQGDMLAERLRVPGGETEDFVRTRLPALVANSGTQNFVTHVTMAKQIATGGPPQLMRNTLSALEALKPVDQGVAELMARTALNPNQHIEVRRSALALAGAMPAEPGANRDYIEGVLLQAVKDAELRDTAVAALRTRPLSDETKAQIARTARNPDGAWAQDVLKVRPEMTHFTTATLGTGRFADRDSCLQFLGETMSRRRLPTP